MQLKVLNSEVIWLFEENGIVHPGVFLQKDYTGSTSPPFNVCDECFFLGQLTYKSRIASSWESLVTTVTNVFFSEKIQLRKQVMLVPEKLQLQKPVYFFPRNFMYKSKNAFSWENIVTKAIILFPEELYVQEQECFFLRKYSYKSHYTFSWGTLCTRTRMLFPEKI